MSTANTLTQTLLRLRARAGQLRPPHADIARLCHTGRPTREELPLCFGIASIAKRAPIEAAAAELIDAGILACEPMFTPRGRGSRQQPRQVLRTLITPDPARPTRARQR